MELISFSKIFNTLAILSSAGFISYYLLTLGNTGKDFRAPLHKIDLAPLTIHINDGRLGNQMFTYATLYGLSVLNKRDMQIQNRTYEVLSEYFDIKDSIVDLEIFVETNPWSIGNWLRERDRSIPVTSNIIKGNFYPTSYTFFDHIYQEIRETFRFKPIYRKYAQDVLWKIKQKAPHTQVYVGIHVRRGDYLKHSQGGWLRAFDGREVDMEYFQEALTYFRNKYDNVTFLAVSDDRDWCRNNLTHLGIITIPDNSPSAGHDLSLLVECNHTIMTYGTFGFWSGYLGGGDVVYFTDFLKPNTEMTRNYFLYDKMYPPNWVGISTTKPGFWENYTNPFLT